MTDCNSTSAQAAFTFFRPQQVTVTFDDGHISNDAGVLLLRQLDDKLGLTRALAHSLVEWRNPLLVEHSLLTRLVNRSSPSARANRAAKTPQSFPRSPPSKPPAI